MSNRHPLFDYADREQVSISAIARKAGCSRMTLYRLAKGEQNATLDLLQSISDATGGHVPITAFAAVRPSRTEDAA